MTLELIENMEVLEDETSTIFLKMLEQAIRDFIQLENSLVPIEQEYYITASGFLFDPQYLLSWGDSEIGLQNILESLHVEEEWITRRIIILKQEYNESRSKRGRTKDKQ